MGFGCLGLFGGAPSGNIVGVATIDEGAAVVLRYDGDALALVRTSVDGEAAWVQPVPLPVPGSLGVRGDQAFLRVADANGHHVLHRFAVESGEPLPSIAPASPVPPQPWLLHPMGPPDELVALFGGGPIALHRLDGAWQSTIAAQDLPLAVRRTADAWVIALSREVRVLDAATGAERVALPTRTAASCVAAGRLWYTDREQVSHVVDPGDPSSVTPLQLGVGDARIAGPCIERGELVLLGMRRDRESLLVAVDPAGAVAWSLELGPGALPGPDTHNHALAAGAPHAAEGATTQFVPLLLDMGAGMGRLVAIDVDARAVVAETVPSAALGGHHLLRRGDAFHLLREQTITTFDGRSGAWRAWQVDGAAAIGPQQVGDGFVWVYGGRSVARLDLDTGALEAAGGLSVVDATSEVLAAFGLPERH